MQPCVLALDLGGTKLASAVFDATGKPVAKRAVPLRACTGTAVGKLIAHEVRRLRAFASRKNAAVAAAAICVPGIARPRTGRVWAPNIPVWEDYPLGATLRAAMDDAKAKVIVESDRSASIMGEVWQGAARGCRSAIFLAVGTGIGAGMLVNGRLVRGVQGSAGAVGWLALDRPFRAEYASCGCFESRASGNGIAKVATEMLIRRKSYRGILRSKPQLTAHDVFVAYEQADEIARDVVQKAIELWGMATANLVSMFNPERIIFGGGVFGPAAQFLDRIADEASRWAQPIASRDVRLEASRLGSDAALYGSAFLALRRVRLI
jgi:glucokinase